MWTGFSSHQHESLRPPAETWVNIWDGSQPRMDTRNKAYPGHRPKGAARGRRELPGSGQALGLGWPRGPRPGLCSELLTGVRATCKGASSPVCGPSDASGAWVPQRVRKAGVTGVQAALGSGVQG